MKSPILAVFFVAATIAAEPVTPAANAINSFGLDLIRAASQPTNNFLISPYSMQNALAMAYAGADGATREEMAKVLHYPEDDQALHRSFADLRKLLDDAVSRSAKQAEEMKKYGATNTPLSLTVANRLYGQDGYAFRPAFLDLVKENYAAPFVPMDFKKDSSDATKKINTWISETTRRRIQNLIPDKALNDLTRLVLVNAIYLKAAWMSEFDASATTPNPFLVNGVKVEMVPTMAKEKQFGYAKRDGFRAVTIPYGDGTLQFLVLLPDSLTGLAAMESKLTPQILNECANLESHEVILHLPKFKMEPPTLALSAQLKKLGMKTAFDQPRGSANFDRMAPRKANDYLSISEVFPKTFIQLDEKGTEAAAATAVMMVWASGIAHEPPKPIEVKVDHPFLFAIQHRTSGACLFLGHVSDPR